MTFGRPSTAERQAQRAAERERNLCALLKPPKTLHRGSYEGGVKADPKEKPVTNEAYRRLVASLPCIVCCVTDYSQAAHPNTGKGAGTKTDDRLCFPLCSDRPGVRGCHPKFDQGALFTKEKRRELEPLWGEQTRAVIRGMGLWPKGLPTLEEGA